MALENDGISCCLPCVYDSIYRYSLWVLDFARVPGWVVPSCVLL
jgi:hypothetical protein